MSAPSYRRVSRKLLKIAGIAAVAALLVTGWSGSMRAQQSLGYLPPLPMKEAGLDIIPVRPPTVYMIAGAGSNIVVHVGWMGVVLVDTGSMGNADKVLAAINRIAPGKRIRFIIDTNGDPDHVANNEPLAQSGKNLMLYVPADEAPNGGFGGSDLETNKGAAGVMAHENVLSRMQNTKEFNYPSFAWPTEPFSGARTKGMYLNGDGVQVIWQPKAHTDGDALVRFLRTDVIATGDLIDMRHFPVIDTDHGGTINGEISALTRLIDTSIGPVPLTWHEDRTLIVPGHGRLLDQGDVVEYRDMLTMVHDRVADLIKKGRNVEQVKAANPTDGYNSQYGKDPALRDAFVTAVFKTINSKP
jgi:glyoxylase-like metal-dependent hydrolase (beta-lactamase superfamily II)